MSTTLTRKESDAWQEYIVGKPCSNHPHRTVMDGKYGPWCGHKGPFGYCDGGRPSEEWLINFRKEQV